MNGCGEKDWPAEGVSEVWRLAISWWQSLCRANSQKNIAICTGKKLLNITDYQGNTKLEMRIFLRIRLEIFKNIINMDILLLLEQHFLNGGSKMGYEYTDTSNV